MSVSVDWSGLLVACAVALGVASYFGRARINRRPQKLFGPHERRAELQARLKAQSSLKTAEFKPAGPLYALTSAMLTQIGARVQRVDPNYAPGAPDSLWLALAAGEDNIGDRLEVSPLEEDDGLWLVSHVETFKFQRPATRWSMTGSLDEVVKDVLARLADSSERIEVRATMPVTRNEYRINLHDVRKMSAFVAAFNDGLIERAGGRWNGQSWDAFNDYLSWPPEESYSLLLDGWSHCSALDRRDLATFEEVLAANPHVSVRRT